MVPFVLLVCVIALPASSVASPAGTVQYTMTAFTNSSEADLYVYESADATTFRPLRGPAFRPPTGLIRDPSIFRHADGNYYIVYTTGWDGNTIGFARSADRVNWTFLRNYTIPLPAVAHTWAPVWFVDPSGGVDIIVSLSFADFAHPTGGDFSPFLLSAFGSSLDLWGPPIPLIGIGQNHIDTILVKVGSQYHAFTKNETTKFVEHAVGPSPAGPYTMVGLGNWAGWGAPLEGQSLVRLPNGGWRIFLDSYLGGKYFFSDSHDEFRSWTPLQQLPGLSGFVRHFTVLAERF